MQENEEKEEKKKHKSSNKNSIIENLVTANSFKSYHGINIQSINGNYYEENQKIK